jgi:hypothetical protein
MKNFREFQFGFVTALGVLPVHLFLTYAYLNNLGDRPLTTSGFLIVNAVFLIIYLLFYGMTTIVNDERIIIIYGVGIIRIHLKLKDVKAMREVTNPIYAGWGIRFMAGGTIYNINGRKALELKFHNKSRFVRIGSKNPSVLMEAIDDRLTAARNPL